MIDRTTEGRSEGIPMKCMNCYREVGFLTVDKGELINGEEARVFLRAKTHFLCMECYDKLPAPGK